MQKHVSNCAIESAEFTHKLYKSRHSYFFGEVYTVLTA